MTDPDWCFKNPASAAADIDALLAWKRQHEAAQTSIAGRYWENRCREAEAERDALRVSWADASQEAEQWKAAHDEVAYREQALAAQLQEQLNDCINFDGGKLTDSVMKRSSQLLKGEAGEGIQHDQDQETR